MIAKDRKKNLNVKLSEAEEGMIDQLTIREDMSRSQLIRRWIKMEWKKIFEEKEGEK